MEKEPIIDEAEEASEKLSPEEILKRFKLRLSNDNTMPERLKQYIDRRLAILAKKNNVPYERVTEEPNIIKNIVGRFLGKWNI